MGCTHPHLELISVNFEVYDVNPLQFRVLTKSEAERLRIRGWCKSTAQGTVQGHIQGTLENVTTMMEWLKTGGNPHTKIDKAEFRNQRHISVYTFDDFSIIKV